MQPIVTQPRRLGRSIAESEYLWFNLNVKLNLPFDCNIYEIDEIEYRLSTNEPLETLNP